MRGDTLVTGGSDGSVRIWSIERNCPIHRLAAHDNSVTSLQFDDTRVVSAGSDGRVKIWDLKTGHLVRELISQDEAVWRVAFEDEKCVALALRQGRTVMEVSTWFPFDHHIRLAHANALVGLELLPPGRDVVRPTPVTSPSPVGGGRAQSPDERDAFRLSPVAGRHRGVGPGQPGRRHERCRTIHRAASGRQPDLLPR